MSCMYFGRDQSLLASEEALCPGVLTTPGISLCSQGRRPVSFAVQTFSMCHDSVYFDPHGIKSGKYPVQNPCCLRTTVLCSIRQINIHRNTSLKQGPVSHRYRILEAGFHDFITEELSHIAQSVKEAGPSDS